jgi:hypothetical protein
MPTSSGMTEIAVRVRLIGQLFNSLDPSPFREKDLDDRIDEFVVGWARELPYTAPFRIVVELPLEEAAKPEAAKIPEAFANYFRHRAAVARRELRELFRVGRQSLLIGIVVLTVCLAGSQAAAAMIGSRVVARMLEESLIFVGWVANWRPLEIYLYDWWPIRRRINLLRRIAAAPVQVRPI